ncbi:hypothetical protein TNCV_2208571 [Trichonephila clavipes]|nr:hypothetical protein TNCV_2208571 [Trichonephila clavipes]
MHSERIRIHAQGMAYPKRRGVSENKYLEFAYMLTPLKGYDLKVSYTRNYPFSKKGLEGVFKKVDGGLIALFMGKGAIVSRRLDFYLLVHGRYFISLLPPIGNQWRRSPIHHLGTRPLGVTGSPEGLDYRPALLPEPVDN